MMAKIKYIVKQMMLISMMLALSVSVFAKSTCTYIDNMLATHLDDLYAHSIQSNNYDEDAIIQHNTTLGKTLKKFAKQKNSLACRYANAKKAGLSFLSSDDNHFRVFVWDTATGGTMHNYDGFIQYVDANNTIHIKNLTDDEEPLHAFPSALFSAKLNGKTHYMLVTTGVFSTMQYSQSLTLYRILKSKLIKPKKIKTRQGVTSRLGFGFNLFSLIDTGRSRDLFKYNKQHKRIRFPVVINNTKYPYGEVTKRWIHYQYDGRYFKRSKH